MDRTEEMDRMTRRLARRERGMQRLRNMVAWTGMMTALAVIATGVERLWWPDLMLLPALIGLAILFALGWAWIWIRAKANLAALLLSADREYDGEEQLSTTFELEHEHPDHPFLPALRARCETLARRVDVPRLVPFDVGRREAAAGIFALAALSLLVIPLSWVHPIQVIDTGLRSPVAEEGLRLEKWSAQLQEIAEHEKLAKVQILATEIQKTSETFQGGQTSPEEAVRDLEKLATLAQSLAESEDPPAKADAHPGTESLAGGELQAIKQMEQGERANTIRESASGTDVREGNLVTTRSDEDPLADRASPGPQRDPESRSRPENEAQNPRILENEFDLERFLLERALRRLTDATQTLNMQIMSVSENQSVNPSRNAMENLQADVNPQVGTPGADRAEANEDAPLSSGGTDALEVQSYDGIPAENAPAKEDSMPEETAFYDTQVRGAETEEASEELWVRQLPMLNAREVIRETDIPEFHRTTVSAQGGMEIPRAYRSVVKAYFIELEQLKNGAN